MRTGGNFEMRLSGNFALRIGGNINANIQSGTRGNTILSVIELTSWKAKQTLSMSAVCCTNWLINSSRNGSFGSDHAGQRLIRNVG
jgi:hypothetical protein